MATRKPNRNTDVIDTTPAELEPVDLDPPNPAIARWQELAERDIDIVHDGDAEKVMPFPRPAWASAHEDEVGRTLGGSFYVSEAAYVPMRHRLGVNDDEVWEPAAIRIRARQCGTGEHYIGFAARQVVDGKMKETFSVGLNPAEALELADVLRAAVDLLGDQ